MRGNSQLRGELKSKARPLVETFFGFESGSNRRIITKNRRLAEFLKETNNFIYKVCHRTTYKMPLLIFYNVGYRLGS